MITVNPISSLFPDVMVETACLHIFLLTITVSEPILMLLGNVKFCHIKIQKYLLVLGKKSLVSAHPDYVPSVFQFEEK